MTVIGIFRDGLHGRTLSQSHPAQRMRRAEDDERRKRKEKEDEKRRRRRKDDEGRMPKKRVVSLKFGKASKKDSRLSSTSESDFGSVFFWCQFLQSAVCWSFSQRARMVSADLPLHRVYTKARQETPSPLNLSYSPSLLHSATARVSAWEHASGLHKHIAHRARVSACH